MANFVFFWPTFAKIWLPWQRPLNPCNQKCLLWIGRPRKPPVISNHILVISHRNAFIRIYNNFSPKTGCHGSATMSLCRGVSEMNSRCTNPISRNSAWIYCIQLKLWPFFISLAYFGQNLVAMVTPLSTLQSEMSSFFFGLDDHENYPVVSNHILAISHRNALECRAVTLPRRKTC